MAPPAVEANLRALDRHKTASEARTSG